MGAAAAKEGGRRGESPLSNVALVGASCCLPGLDYRRAELIIMMMMTMLAKKKTGSTKAGFIDSISAYQIIVGEDTYLILILTTLLLLIINFQFGMTNHKKKTPFSSLENFAASLSTLLVSKMF